MPLTIHRKPIKSLRIRVLPSGEVIVSAPKRLSDAYINSFIKDRKDRIEKALARVKKAKEQLPVGENEILLYGVAYAFTYEPALKQKTVVEHEEKVIYS